MCVCVRGCNVKTLKPGSQPETLKVGWTFQGFWVSRFLHYTHTYVHKVGRLAQLSRLLGSPTLQVSDLLGFQVSDFPGFCVSDFPGFQLSRFPTFQVWHIGGRGGSCRNLESAAHNTSQADTGVNQYQPSRLIKTCANYNRKLSRILQLPLQMKQQNLCPRN